jgi:hypothetical protein
VVELRSVLRGQPGRPSESLTFAQTEAILTAAANSRIRECIVLSLLTGARPAPLRRRAHPPARAPSARGTNGSTPDLLSRPGTAYRSPPSSIRQISHLAGHRSTTVYQHQIRPVRDGTVQRAARRADVPRDQGRGVPDVVLQVWAGHSDATVTKRYYVKAGLSDLQRASDALERELS